MILNDSYFDFEIDRFPPSVNHAYYFIKKGKATIKVRTTECKAFVDYIHNLFPETFKEINNDGKTFTTKKVKPFSCPVGLQLTITMGDNRKRDMDNMLKILIDSMNGKAFVDDSQISYIEMVKKKGESHKIRVKVFDVTGSRNKTAKCPGCGREFPKSDLIAKMDLEKGGTLIGYYCEWCW